MTMFPKNKKRKNLPSRRRCSSTYRGERPFRRGSFDRIPRGPRGDVSLVADSDPTWLGVARNKNVWQNVLPIRYRRATLKRRDGIPQRVPGNVRVVRPVTGVRRRRVGVVVVLMDRTRRYSYGENAKNGFAEKTENEKKRKPRPSNEERRGGEG